MQVKITLHVFSEKKQRHLLEQVSSLGLIRYSQKYLSLTLINHLKSCVPTWHKVVQTSLAETVIKP